MRALLALTLLAAACAPVVAVGVAPGDEAATVLGRWERKPGWDQLRTWRSYVLESVDGAPVRKKPLGFLYELPVVSDPQDTVVRVAPGRRRLLVRARFQAGEDAAPREALVTVEAPVRPGRRYRLNGAVRGRDFAVWLEDAAGARVGAESSAPHAPYRPAKPFGETTLAPQAKAGP